MRKRMMVASIVALVVCGMAMPASADGEAPESRCSQRDWADEGECTFSYQGTTLIAGFYGAGLLTVERDGPAGTREVIFHCLSHGNGCIGGWTENRPSMPFGTPLYCHVRGTSGSRFACYSGTPSGDGDIWI